MTLKIQIVSDIHTEFYKSDQGRKILQKISESADDVDILMVAGDLSTNKGLRYAFSILCDKYKHVVYVPGNHEYYGSDLETTHDILEECTKKHSNLHWLCNRVKIIAGQRFVGTPLWFPDVPAARKHKDWLTDFGVIRNFEDWIWDEFNKNKSFLENTVEEGDVIITHHLTTPKSIHYFYAGEITNCYFLGDISDIIKNKKPALSVHGHTHEACDYEFFDTRVVCNPVGYPQENKPFNNKIIEI